MKSFKQHINEKIKTYSGKGWVLGTKDEPKPKDKTFFPNESNFKFLIFLKCFIILFFMSGSCIKRVPKPFR